MPLPESLEKSLSAPGAKPLEELSRTAEQDTLPDGGVTREMLYAERAWTSFAATDPVVAMVLRSDFHRIDTQTLLNFINMRPLEKPYDTPLPILLPFVTAQGVISPDVFARAGIVCDERFLELLGHIIPTDGRSRRFFGNASWFSLDVSDTWMTEHKNRLERPGANSFPPPPGSDLSSTAPLPTTLRTVLCLRKTHLEAYRTFDSWNPKHRSPDQCSPKAARTGKCASHVWSA